MFDEPMEELPEEEMYININKIRETAELDSFKGVFNWSLLETDPQAAANAMEEVELAISEDLPRLENIALKLNSGRPVTVEGKRLTDEEREEFIVSLVPALYEAYVIRAMRNRVKAIMELTA